MSSKLSSIPRRNKLWAILCWMLAVVVTSWVWPVSESISGEQWQAYGSAIASASAAMVGLTVAITALLYALLSTPLFKFLHDKGALNRLLFDLMWCAAAWLAGLGLSLLGSLPEAPNVNLMMQAATVSALAGLFGFLPVGATYWMLLSNSGKQPRPGLLHDFDKPTDLS